MKWKPAETSDPLIQHRHAIGQRVKRLDGPLKVSGQAKFAAEVELEGLTYAALVHSTIARGRVESIDISKAQAAAGVVLVMTYRNAPRMAPPPLYMSAPLALGPSTLPVLQDDSVHWNGQPVAVVLADTQEQADFAASLIEVSYVQEAARLVFDDGKPSARVPANILGEPAEIEHGDAEAALKAAYASVDRRYQTPRYVHSAIELHAATMFWKDGELTIHDSTQAVNHMAWTLGQVFGIEQDKIHVSSPFVGGGFGGKSLWTHHILAAAAAKLSERPVRIVLTREGVYRLVGGRTCTDQRVALAARADGTLDALVHEGTAASTPHNEWAEQFTFTARQLYAARAFKIGQKIVDLDMVANTYMRAPGEAVGTFALESAVDELAEKLAIDPVELRRRIEPEIEPISGREFSSRHLLTAYEMAARQFGWKPKTARSPARRDGEWLVGVGCATATHPYYRLPGAAARIRLLADGQAIVQIASHEMGMGTSTAQTQIASDRLGLPMDQIRFEYGDTSLPAATMAGGSSQTASISGAVIAAHEALVEQLLTLAGEDSALAGLTADQVESAQAGLRSRRDPTRHERYVDILKRAGRAELACEANGADPTEWQKRAMHSYGAMFCEVRVNAVTAEVRVARFVACFDVGRIINPQTAASQLRGGIIMGLGLALSEEVLFDERSGRIMNASLAEYHVPVHMDVPAIDVLWTDIPDPYSPVGAHGVGEIGITGAAAAVANAVYDATGVRVRDLPITLDKLLDALSAQAATA